MKKLVILRGNSGSGNAFVSMPSLTQSIFLLISSCEISIVLNPIFLCNALATVVFPLPELPLSITNFFIDTKALPLMIELLKYGNEHSDIVILEGIMYDEWYNPLFNVANELYGANVYSYYFNIPFEETVRRHQTRSKSQEFGEEHMRQWWREKDFSSVLEEEIISCEMDAECIIEKIYTDLLKYI